MKRINLLIVLLALNLGFNPDLIAQNLIKVMEQDVALNAEQQKYKEAILENTELTVYKYVEIDTKQLGLENNQIAHINIPDELNASISREKSYRVSGDRLVWIGRSPDLEGFVRFVVNDDIVNAKINLLGHNYSIFPLTDGLHLMFKDSDAKQGKCDEEGFQQRSGPDPNYDPGDPPSADNGGENQRMAGECRLRMMVVFTQAVKTASADVTNLVEGHIADWNIYNSNSNVDYDVELARCIATNYVATGNSQVHPTYGDDSEDMIRLYEPADGFMDEMHTIRNQYDADLVSLFVTTLHSGLGGEALPIGAVASDAFHTMLWNNGAFTFAHESGHLFGQRHSHDTNNSPFSYGHGWHVVSEFATVMAYTSQCSPCSRIPNWSNPNISVSGFATGTAAFGDCARVQREEDQTMAGFQLTVSNKLQFTNDTISDEEQADLLGNNYIETNLFTVIIENGGSASYRAANYITLEEGFHAKSGSVFDAFLDNCTAMNIANPSSSSKDNGDANILGTDRFDWVVYPNPTNELTYIDINLTEEANVRLVLYNYQGQVVNVIADQSLMPAGIHKLNFDANIIRDGVYFVVLIKDGEQQMKRVVIQK